MKTNRVLITDAVRTVRRTAPRFISIIAIVALGISFFAGLNATAPDMLDTMQRYMVDTNAMDIQIISTAGITDSDIAAVASINGVEAVRGEKYVDGVVKANGQTVSDIDGSEMTIRVFSLDMNDVVNCSNGYNDPSYMNRPELIEGSWPTSSNQCVVDQSYLSTPEEFKIGTVLTIEGAATDITGSLANTEYTVVGIIRTPLYISYERGNTNVGTGKLGTFCYVPSENFLIDYYTSMSVRLEGSGKYDPYSKEYDAFVANYVNFLNSISAELLAPRVEQLKTEYSALVADYEEQYAIIKNQVDQSIADGEAQVALILDLAENGDQYIIEAKQKYNDLAAQAESTIDASKYEHSTQYAAWEEKKKEYEEAKATLAQYSNAEAELTNAQTEWNVASLQVSSMLSTVEYLETLVATTRSALDQFNATQDNGVQGIIDRFNQSGLTGAEVDNIINTINSLTAVGTAEEIMAYMEPQLQTFEVNLAMAKEDLMESRAVLAQKEVELKEAERLVAQLKELEKQLIVAEQELAAAEKALESAGYDIQFGELEVLTQLSKLQSDIADLETQVTLAKQKAPTVVAEFEAAKNEAYAKLENARNQLDQAQQFLIGLDNAKWYVNTRSEALLGFTGYEQAANRTAALSLIFPWFFFLVASLVCLNTMTRMIEEDRTRLGTFKALGLTDKEIMSKYLIYALMASSIGSVGGSFLGFAIFPTAITSAYGILFDVPDIEMTYRIGYAVPGILISVSLTVLATYTTCRKSLKVVPATLMRSKAPKGGKRVFLERFPAIWSRLNFIWKVTFRNVFRNFKRFFMATLAVGGCTALLLAGFGLNDSIDRTIENQFIKTDRVWSYDMQIVLNGSYSSTDCDAYSAVSENALISTALLNYMKVYDATSSKTDDTLESYLLVPEDASALGTYINLTNRTSGQVHQLGDNGAIITEKLASTLKIRPGDSITLIVDESHSVNIPVAAVVENYTFHYVYLSRNLYASIFGAYPSYNYITANLSIPEENLTAEQKNNLAKELMGEYEISAVAFTSQILNSFENIMDSISALVVIIIVSAALLAFIVLYNLSIINITERTKEIATIKVLGFDNLEVSSYIFRENFILTVIGIIEGLFVGVFLHKLVLVLAEVDVLMFGRGLSATSFLYAAALAFVFSMFVSVVLHNKLKKVDIVESLKSIE